jgi:hypothetical protein
MVAGRVCCRIVDERPALCVDQPYRVGEGSRRNRFEILAGKGSPHRIADGLPGALRRNQWVSVVFWWAGVPKHSSWRNGSFAQFSRSKYSGSLPGKP